MNTRRPIPLIAICIFLADSAVSTAATLNVPADQPTIQAGIDAAVSGVDEVVVAPGTYNEIIDFLGKAITVRSSGGAAVTIIDATLVADPGTGKPVVRCDSGEGPDTVLDGFTITGGTGDTSFDHFYSVGGGMFNNGFNITPTVTNCTFTGNTADRGGGMFNNGFDNKPVVTNCTFTGNTATIQGGGMYNRLGGPTVTDCVFSANSADSGGGMYNFGANSTVTNCTFSGNSARNGGGMYNHTVSPTVTTCTFSGNTANGDGGGMYNLSIASPTVTNCTFSGNTANGNGGGMYNDFGSPTVTDCTFTGNMARGGGGMYGGGGSPTVMNCAFNGNMATGGGGGMGNEHSSPTVTNCAFSGNSANGNGARGGGMSNVGSGGSPTARNCTFSGNTATGDGGGMYNIGSSSTVTNCIFWGNADPGGMDESAQIHVISGTMIVHYSDVQGGWTGAGSNNINADPLFVTGPEGDFYLSQIAAGQGSDSPCVDAGSGHHALFFLKGTTRTDEVGDLGTVDMGFHYSACVGSPDLDGDGDVDVFDFLTFSNCFNGDLNPPNPGCLSIAADHDCDGDVDGNDFLTFSNCFNGALNPPKCP